ncbi:glycoside hydrolase 43 family protein [Paenibacillus aurantius]|uniref:Glycoside hydrolase 43 family protein n=1 Tax=Paenibacillus aurantius TaxID=2918900 RepID=A0AA96LG32_9BACL|nr:glycoside hydrolase 43 family protein [Paenibacillus aurantius]WNQ13237.1 glycoside hydrolase 43 family protein [Paenibacillus aurantius]
MTETILTHQEAWAADQGDGTYLNPVLHADYSDPDVIRVGSDFYMTASSFGHLPGLPILHSQDLVNWKLIGHAIPEMKLAGYERPQHGNGVWAPSLRYHDGKYWIFYGDPDVGILMTTADDPAGEWAPLHLVLEGKGLIDVCPFWDNDGQAYLIHAYAKSRSGIKHKLRLCRMSADGRQVLDEGRIVYDGTEDHPTLEGPKLYKREGYYYIFAPAGGVSTGWQTVFRSESIWGPYEDKVVLHQGQTPVNGPHQGGWVELESGESWFLHFQDKGPYGRVVHLQPVHWENDWPMMGERREGEAIGEPVLRYRKPDVGRDYPVTVPATSDEFDAPALGLQWQWQANPHSSWYRLDARPSHIRLHSIPGPSEQEGIYHASHLLLQKFPAPEFQASCLIDPSGLAEGDTGGMLVFGYRYAYLAVRKLQDEGEEEGEGEGLALVLAMGDENGEEGVWSLPIESADPLELRVKVEKDARCSFYYKMAGSEYTPVPAEPFAAIEGHWVGAKTGIFASGSGGGYVDVDWFRVTGLEGKE